MKIILRENMKIKKFSLIELLIVFSVLLILASLLSSTLKDLSSRARQVECFGNLRNMGHTMSLYLSDNMDTFMDHRRGDHHNWHDHLLALGLSEDNFLCSERGSEWESRRNPGTYIPVVTKTTPKTYYSSIHLMPYGYNGYWLGFSQHGSRTSGPIGRNYTLLTDIVNPSKMIAISDSSISIRDTWASSIWYTQKNTNEGVAAVHQNNTSILYVDGHASSEDATTVNQSVEWDPYWRPRHD